MMTLDLNQEMLVEHYKNGIRLTRPDRACITSDKRSAKRKLQNILNMPLNAYVVTADNIIQICNDSMLTTFNSAARNDIIGKSILGVLPSDTAQQIIINNSAVMNESRLKIIEEHCKVNSVLSQAISFKWPLYDLYYKMIGTFGFTIKLGLAMNEFANNLALLTETGLLSPSILTNIEDINSVKTTSGTIYFTCAEKRILYFLMRGNTAKQIAEKLHLSVRTVEKHLENCRIKAEVNSKGELIDLILGTDDDKNISFQA